MIIKVIKELNATNSLGPDFSQFLTYRTCLFVKLAQPIRIDLTGSFINPDIFLGKGSSG
jgi:hypothetical protein